MSNKNNATKSDASQEEIIVRLFERGDSERIMDVDFSMKGVRIYKWLDGKLVKGKEYYDDEDFSSEEKKEIVEKFGPYPSGRHWVKCGAFAGDVMVGFLVMFLYPSEQHMWGISYSFVSRKYQRQGIATRMFAFSFEAAVCALGLFTSMPDSFTNDAVTMKKINMMNTTSSIGVMFIS